MKLLTALAGGIAVSTLGFAQESSTPPSAHWSEFKRSHGANWQVRWNKATRTPQAIYGEGLRLDDGPTEGLNDARRRADRVLRGFEDLLGLGTSQFRETIGQHVRQSFIFVYQQEFRGLEVLGGRADVRVHANGAISMFGSKALQIEADFGVIPTIGDALAKAIAMQRARAGGDAEVTDRLLIYADVHASTPQKPRLAYEVRIRGDAPLFAARVFVDAHTGAVISYWNEVYTCAFGHEHVRGESDHAPTSRMSLAREIRRKPRRGNDVTGTVMGYMNASPNGGAAATNQPIPNVLVSIDGGASDYTDENGFFSIPASGANPVTVRTNFATNRSRYARGGVYTFEGVGDPFCNPATPGCNNNPPVVPSAAVEDVQVVLPGGAPITLQLAGSQSEFEVSQVTSYWHVNDVNEWMRSLHGNTTQLNLISNLSVYTNWGTSCNAFYTNNQVHFFQAGSCTNSAFMTIVYHEWGHGIDDVYGGLAVNGFGEQVEGMSEAWGDTIAMYRSGLPQIGLGFGSGGLVRTGTNNQQYPPPALSQFVGPHTQGQSFMGWAWDLRTNLVNSLGTANGAAVAEQIVLGSIVADAASQPDCVLEIFLLDDDDANLLNGTPHYAELQAASLGRSMPYPEALPAHIAHVGLEHTQKPYAPRAVRAVVTSLTGSISSVELQYDAGSGALTRPMVPTGNPDEYVGLLPGVPSPQLVKYRIVGSVTTGQTTTWPLTNDHVYVVGTPTPLFDDTLDSGTNGWTHGLDANQDDWQRGDPDGDSGDPEFARSAPAVWANDLGQTIGGQRWNGVYQNDTENWLRTPSIDGTSAVGVFLEFYRWLNVESGQYDQAEVNFVGGPTLWTNPFLDDLTDSEWHRMRLPVPQLENATGQLEWRLRTDGGVVAGGWTIDDVRVMRTDPVPDPQIVFTATPEQIPASGSSTLQSSGTPGAPSALLLATQPGPTPVLPGVTLEVGPAFFAIPINTDAAGQFQTTVNGSAGLAGTLLHAQIVEIAAGTIHGSNAMLLLMTN